MSEEAFSVTASDVEKFYNNRMWMYVEMYLEARIDSLKMDLTEPKLTQTIEDVRSIQGHGEGINDVLNLVQSVREEVTGKKENDDD